MLYRLSVRRSLIQVLTCIIVILSERQFGWHTLIDGTEAAKRLLLRGVLRFFGGRTGTIASHGSRRLVRTHLVHGDALTTRLLPDAVVAILTVSDTSQIVLVHFLAEEITLAQCGSPFPVFFCIGRARLLADHSVHNLRDGHAVFRAADIGHCAELILARLFTLTALRVKFALVSQEGRVRQSQLLGFLPF